MKVKRGLVWFSAGKAWRGRDRQVPLGYGEAGTAGHGKLKLKPRSWFRLLTAYGREFRIKSGLTDIP